MANTIPPSNESSRLQSTVQNLADLLDHFSSAIAATASPRNGPFHTDTLVPAPPSSTPSATNQTHPHDPLQTLSTTATLLRAQTTKLSLLLINKPFTPSAVRSVLADVAARCVPALMGAWHEGCGVGNEDPGGAGVRGRYGKLMGEEIRGRMRRVVEELRGLLVLVRTVGGDTAAAGRGEVGDDNGGSASKHAPRIDSQNQKDTASSTSKTAQPKSRPITTKNEEQLKAQILTKTGQLFSSLDSLSELHTLQLPGLLVQKAAAYRALIEDATAELREWRDDAEDEGFESGEEGEDVVSPTATATNDTDIETDITARASILSLDNGTAPSRPLEPRTPNLPPPSPSPQLSDPGAFLSAAHRLPSHRHDLKTLLDATLQILKLTSGLCAAVEKWRFACFPVPISAQSRIESEDGEKQQRRGQVHNVGRVDDACSRLRSLSESTDELAEKFYELDADGAGACLRGIVEGGVEVVRLLEGGWTEDDDGKGTAACGGGEEGGRDKFQVWAARWRGAVGSVAGAVGIGIDVG